MDRYYYFASQLPFLKFNEKANLEKDYFLEEARKWLKVKDFEILYRVDINDFYKIQGGFKILNEYKEFEEILRRNLASKRKAAKGAAGSDRLEFLKPNLLEGTPLEVEKKLLFLRWEFIETLEQGHYFDLEFFVLYFLKLQILEKLFTFNKEKGTKIFDEICEVRL